MSREGRPLPHGAAPERVIREISRIAFSSYTDFVEILEEQDEQGTPHPVIRLRPLDQIPKSKLAAIASLKQTSSGIELKLYDKWRALETLAKILGMSGGETDTGQAAEEVRIIDDI